MTKLRKLFTNALIHLVLLILISMCLGSFFVTSSLLVDLLLSYSGRGPVEKLTDDISALQTSYQAKFQSYIQTNNFIITLIQFFN